MRYPIIFAILCLLVLALPLHRHHKGEPARVPVVNYLLNADQQEASMQWLDSRVNDLRALPPLHQAMAMLTFIILVLSAAVVVAYLVNSLAAIANIGLSLLFVLPLLLLAVIGFKNARKALQSYTKAHPEFGPMVSRLNTRLWKRRFNRASREHGFVREY